MRTRNHSKSTSRPRCNSILGQTVAIVRGRMPHRAWTRAGKPSRHQTRSVTGNEMFHRSALVLSHACHTWHRQSSRESRVPIWSGSTYLEPHGGRRSGIIQFSSSSFQVLFRLDGVCHRSSFDKNPSSLFLSRGKLPMAVLANSVTVEIASLYFGDSAHTFVLKSRVTSPLK